MTDVAKQESAVGHNQREYGPHTLGMYISTVGDHLNSGELDDLRSKDEEQNNSPPP